MYNRNDLKEAMQNITLGAVANQKPSEIMYGTVLTEEPLTIDIEQKMTLGEKQLTLTRNVTDYEVEMTVDHLTEKRGGGTGEAEYEEHDHEYKGKKVFLVHHALKVGEKVVLARRQGGQDFIVLDRVVEA